MATRSSAAAASAALLRSDYVSRLRRAFLLRAHPDRFRSHPPSVRRRQAELVQAIGERMSHRDFVAYGCPGGGGGPGGPPCGPPSGTSNESTTYDYVLERKDGSLQRNTIRLDDAVESVLDSMASALERTGVGGNSIPSPPPPLAAEERTTSKGGDPSSVPRPRFGGDFEGMRDIFYGGGPRRPGADGVDRRFDVNTARGRDLRLFLRTLDPCDVERNRSNRMDAIAAALVLRRSYGFQAVDGTGLGWSSSSLAIVLGSLAALHDEHRAKFKVKSFYPLRLAMSSDECRDKLDLYGGILRLNPASTPLQWLETLRSVTDDKLRTLKANREALRENVKHVQEGLAVRMAKGHSCTSEEYHSFAARLASTLCSDRSDGDKGETTLRTTSTALAPQRVVLVVESSQACPRVAKLTREGRIRVGSDMDGPDVVRSVSRLTADASRAHEQERSKETECKERIDVARVAYGLRAVTRAKGLGSKATTDQVLDCLGRLLSMDVGKPREEMRARLAGNSLGIAGSGRFCHLGDDGSIVVPWDWR